MRIIMDKMVGKKKKEERVVRLIGRKRNTEERERIKTKHNKRGTKIYKKGQERDGDD